MTSKFITKEIQSLKDVASDFDCFIIDLWGVLHDGTDPYPEAIDTLKFLKDNNKKIVLLSNAPRRAIKAVEVLEKLGFKSDFYHKIITSGEICFDYVNQNPDNNLGAKKYFYIGPEKDQDVILGAKDAVQVSNAEDADFAIATGYDGFHSTFDEKKDLLDAALKNNLLFLCANPDRMVVKQTGEKQICSGIMAEYYQEQGGKVIYFGKPYKSAYDVCNEYFGTPDKNRVLCIGDSLHTDILGGNDYGFKTLLVSGGILHNEITTKDKDEKNISKIDFGKLQELCNKENANPDFVINQFRLTDAEKTKWGKF